MSNGVLTNLLCSPPLGQSQQPFHVPHDFSSVVSFLSHLPCSPASPFPARCSCCVSLTPFWLFPMLPKLTHVRAAAFSCALCVALGGKQLVGWAVGSGEWLGVVWQLKKPCRKVGVGQFVQFCLPESMWQRRGLSVFTIEQSKVILMQGINSQRVMNTVDN